jgi:hypothetical protein
MTSLNDTETEIKSKISVGNKCYNALGPILKRRYISQGGEVCTGFCWGNLRERDHWGDPDLYGRIILRWIFRKWEGIVRTGWSWLRIATGGWHL